MRARTWLMKGALQRQALRRPRVVVDPLMVVNHGNVGVIGSNWRGLSGTSKRGAFFDNTKKSSEGKGMERPKPSHWGSSLGIDDNDASTDKARSDGWVPLKRNSDNKIIKPTGDARALNPDEFEKRSRAALDGVLAGLQMLQDSNPNMIATFNEELAMKHANDPNPGFSMLQIFFDGNATFHLSAMPATQELVLFSPESGGNSYMWYPKRGRWLCVENGHDLEGILTRDLLRWMYGVPNFQL